MIVRPHKTEDLRFIFDTYLETWRLSKFAGVVPNNLFFEVHRTLLEDLIARGARFGVACHEDKPDVILGWSCYEVKEDKNVLHYLFVRDSHPDVPGPGAETALTLINALPARSPGWLTHKLFHPALRGWLHTPEMARRKTL